MTATYCISKPEIEFDKLSLSYLNSKDFCLDFPLSLLSTFSLFLLISSPLTQFWKLSFGKKKGGNHKLLGAETTSEEKGLHLFR